jgi:hypothetical protein
MNALTKYPTEQKAAARDAQDPHKELPLALSDAPDKKGTLDSIFDHYRAWLPKYQEFAQGRSDFQIEKIIATEHITPATSYQHTLYQLRVMHQGLMQDIVRGIERTRELEYKWKGKPKDEPVWWETERGGKKLCWYDTDHMQYEHEIEELKMSVKDKLLQMETFTKVLAAMEAKHGGEFAAADLDAEEPEYWKLRLARQMTDDYLDRQTGLGGGNIRTLRMAVAESPVAGSKNKVEDFPDLFNAALGGREAASKILNEVNEMLLRGMNSLGQGGSSALENRTSPKIESARDTAPRFLSEEEEEAALIKRLGEVGISVSKDQPKDKQD